LPGDHKIPDKAGTGGFVLYREFNAWFVSYLLKYLRLFAASSHFLQIVKIIDNV